MERITIIGMGPIGVSVGLALKRANLKNTEIVGSAGDRHALSTAAKMGAVDESDHNLRSAIKGAQMIVLDVPFSQMRELLNAVAPIVEDGCVITDTGTTKVRVMEWADELLPKSVSFVGGHPLLKAQITSIEDAHEDLFRTSEYCIMPSNASDEQSVKTVVGLVEMLGAKPHFLDAHEHDSYTVAMDMLPVVLSTAFVNATAGQSSWREMYKLATATFADYSKLASGDPLDNEAGVLSSPDSLVHWIDQVIGELYNLRNQINEKSDDLVESFINAWEARARWEAGAVVPKDGPSLPSARDSMATAFLGERLSQRMKQMSGGGEDKEPWKYRGQTSSL